MRVHNDWSTSAFGLPSVAAAVGPFVRACFLQSVTRLEGDDVVFIEGDDGLWPLVMSDGRIVMAGHRDLTDYHSPLGNGADSVLTEYAATLDGGTAIEFDSLPREGAELAAKGLEMAGISATVSQHAVAAVLELPADFDTYLQNVGKKQRHEIRRKRRRYEEAVGDLQFERHTTNGWGFDEFVRLHRLSDGEKGEFMTGPRLEFFESLMATDGWVVDLLRHHSEDRATACLFAFVDDDYYLYNSSYDPELSEGSPGVALLGSAIERAIEDRCRYFDFLKGGEVYKFRLGAEQRPLFTVTGRT